MERVKTRFAPSPTGFLHIGGARTAVFNWAFARKESGIFLIRIEDTDRERSSPEFEKAILEDLRWLGLDWDEGPYRQSERFEVYRSSFVRLKEKNLVYPCYCTPQELEEERVKALREGKPPRYSGKCFFLSPEERRKREAEGRQPSWRFRIPLHGEISFSDLVRGQMVFHTSSLGDFIILKSDGSPTYNFACVVDDALMGISHILRGEEHLPNTPYQVLLYQALGFPLPHFAHLPIILDENRAKLSKRRGDTSLRFFQEEGILPQALLNYLFTLGHSFEEGKEILGKEELVASFSLKRVGKAGAIFNEERLRWMNRIYLRKIPWQELQRYLSQVQGGKEIGEVAAKLGAEQFLRLWSLACEEASSLKELWRILQGLMRKPEKVELTGERVAVLPFLCQVARRTPAWKSEEEVREILKTWQKESGMKPAVFYKTLRLILIGREEGPELHRLLFALGREEFLARVSVCIAEREV
ncbi:MAG: glutamate--tRNA ligase [Candidatus Caldatribacteriaceae bacterium]